MEKVKSHARLVVTMRLTDCLKSGFAVFMPDFCEQGGMVHGIAVRVNLQQGGHDHAKGATHLQEGRAAP